MASTLRSNLGRRILLLVTVSTLLVFFSLLASGWLAVNESYKRVLDERLSLAQAIGNYVDYVLKENLARLDEIEFAPGVDFTDGNLEPEKKALHSMYFGSIFDGGVFIADENGRVLWVEPFQQDFANTNLGNYPAIKQSLTAGKPYISNILYLPDGKKAILLVSPVRDWDGKAIGLVGGRINVDGRKLQEFISPAKPGEATYIDILDENGIVVASNDPTRRRGFSLKETGQKEPEVTSLFSLESAPWSIMVRQSAKEATAPANSMQRWFVTFGILSLFVAFSLSWGMARSVVRPVSQLTEATRYISRGDLSRPIPSLGNDEIADLAQNFDFMRKALSKSLDEIQQWNRELEAKVKERTRELEESQHEIEEKETARSQLLRKVLTIQEEERKRIARELHDETTQSILALVMRLEATLAASKDLPAEAREKLLGVKSLAIKTLDNVHKVIFDLRPSVLDDLGLLSAIRWYADNRLVAEGIKTRVEVTGEETKLPPQVEIALFRVVQEAISNICKHAEAHSVVISVEFTDTAIKIEIEDDGKGFDPATVNPQAGQVQGMGLLGMKERITLLGGKFNLEAHPGSGTHLTVEVEME